LEKKQKVAIVDSLTERFQGIPNAFLVDYRGLNVTQSSELRKKFRENDSDFFVVKNTLALRAAESTPIELLKDHFSGPTAIALNQSDPVVIAKIIKDFTKDYPVLRFKAAIAEGVLISAKECEEIANLPPREALLGKLIYLMGSGVSKLGGMMQAPLRNLMHFLDQYKEKADKGAQALKNNKKE